MVGERAGARGSARLEVECQSECLRESRHEEEVARRRNFGCVRGWMKTTINLGEGGRTFSLTLIFAMTLHTVVELSKK